MLVHGLQTTHLEGMDNAATAILLIVVVVAAAAARAWRIVVGGAVLLAFGHCGIPTTTVPVVMRLLAYGCWIQRVLPLAMTMAEIPRTGVRTLGPIVPIAAD